MDCLQTKHRRGYGGRLPEGRRSRIRRGLVLNRILGLNLNLTVVARRTSRWTQRGSALSCKCQLQPPALQSVDVAAEKLHRQSKRLSKSDAKGEGLASSRAEADWMVQRDTQMDPGG